MAAHVIDYLKASGEAYPEKVAFADQKNSFTFRKAEETARRIGSAIMNQGIVRQPVAVYMEKTVESIVSFLGVVCSGNFYCPLDTRMPAERVNTILSVLKPAVILTDQAHKESAQQFAFEGHVLLYEEAIAAADGGKRLDQVISAITETDPLYVLFTSGSTGVPKGVLVSERVVTNYMEWLDETFDISSEDVFGNQAPLYFDVSVHDIYSALYFGARMEIIPPSYFSFPIKLIEYMDERKITSFLWVPSAMGIVAKLDVFSFAVPQYLRHVMFAGEVLQRKHLDYWRRYLPHAVYANLYGPTETYVCTAFVMPEGMEGDGPLPIGQPIRNSQALILDEEGREVADGEEGELCMRGSCLAIGYYGDLERTKASFQQNPCCSAYPDRIYRTGDLVKRDKEGQLVYLSRKDYQIKHMGYRIELGEIEAAADRVEGIADCACIYDEVKGRIIFCYDGKELEKKSLEQELAKRLPAYMMPSRFVYYPALPHNANGKIDRKKLKEMQK